MEDRKQAAKLNERVKWMLWNAAAIDPKLPTPDKLHDTCKQFFAQLNWASADQELCHCFGKLGLEDIAWFKGALKALYTGKFIYMNPGSPSNFSAFVFYEEQAIARSVHNSCHVPFHFQQSEGSGLMADKIHASTKQTIRIPAKFVSLGRQLNFSEELSASSLVQTASGL